VDFAPFRLSSRAVCGLGGSLHLHCGPRQQFSSTVNAGGEWPGLTISICVKPFQPHNSLQSGFSADFASVRVVVDS